MPYRYCFSVVALLFLSGCARGPSDEAIATQIKARFFSDPQVKLASLSVSVKQADVTIAGDVPSAEVQLQAYKLA